MVAIARTRRTTQRLAAALSVALLGGGALAACGSGPPTASPPSTTTTTSAPVVTGVQNLVVTPTVSAELVAAAAASHGLPVRDYVGLRTGETFYAYDPADHLYWAGAALEPSRSSFQAQVGVQDDGAYNLFTRTANGTWTAFNDGLGTIAGTSCGAVVPPEVRAVWGWSLTTPCGGPPPARGVVLAP